MYTRQKHTAPRERAALRADERVIRWVDEHTHVLREGLGPRRRDDAARDAGDAASQRHALSRARSALSSIKQQDLKSVSRSRWTETLHRFISPNVSLII